jgi:hypothetical protein
VTLSVVVGSPQPSGDTRVVSVAVTVEDSDHPRIGAAFGYLVGDAGRAVFLRSLQVAPATGTPVGQQRRLTVTTVRNLPLARWEAAARAHLAQVPGFQPASADDVLFVLRHVTPKDRVDRLYPGLAESKRPADVRKYRGLLHLAAVAEDFVREQLSGSPDPGAAIARQHNVKPATARSWVHRARKAGLLASPPEGGQPS